MIQAVTTTAAKAFERFVVNRLPYRHANRNGVVVGRGRVWERDGEDLDHKRANCDALRRHVDRGDRVVVVGGGVGVSTVVAARATGPHGHVDTFEAASGLVSRVRDTARRNNMASVVDVHHAVVGDFVGGEFSVETFGVPDGDPVPPDELPACDVLFTDCEGAEHAILGGLDRDGDLPRVMIVETHDFLGADTETSARLLQGLGYRITHHEVTRSDGEGAVLVADREGS